ncbi:hypothetical protein MHM84_00970 [Halomonas sp. McH1-25]|uniref:hypothetical protein n=1 Tax=unclassified Halomonas TaxID=2609666 RepID=UPI001EF630E8|nr:MULTISPECIES: hypothetical protein [unclassified Halomonas]MCG7598353.1 hypothetical protein [Halomonas sp. McH1-25]MCP1342705.1 hypothetical protein [Halomonas sp. FL8]MCP1362176.1 hypothetical protein [Halomonas sp. BBD45]MCP1364230.1 hypothetical protein [Halomonas sp. BBD48]
MPTFLIQKDYETGDANTPDGTFQVITLEDENGNDMMDEFGIDPSMLYPIDTGDAEIASQIGTVLELDPGDIELEESNPGNPQYRNE